MVNFGPRKGIPMHRVIRARAEIFLLVMILTGSTFAQQAVPAVGSRHLVDSLHVLKSHDGTKRLVSIGDDGTMIVDNGYAITASEAGEKLARLGSEAVNIIINTHGDIAHVGGDGVLGKDAVIISHPATRVRVTTYFSLPESLQVGIPNLTAATETKLFFNGDVIRVLPFAGGLTDGDLVIHFTRARVAYVGDLVLGESFPSVDPERGGDPEGLARVLDELIRVLPDDTVVVPAHGKDLTMTGLRHYQEMVEGSIAAVKKEIDDGHDLEAILEAQPLAPWLESGFAMPGLNTNAWTTQIYGSLTDSKKTSICAPVTQALVGLGIEAAVLIYRRLKVDEADVWNFAEDQLNTLGYQLLQRSMIEEAIEVFQLNVESYPERPNTHDSLGEAFAEAGEIDPAIASYERCLELAPYNASAAIMLKLLRGESEQE